MASISSALSSASFFSASLEAISPFNRSFPGKEIFCERRKMLFFA
jgi:hypothetical protein